MATTLSVIIVRRGIITLGHCGDTRIALQRGNGIKQLTRDHTEARRLFDAGKLTKSEYLHYPRRNILDSALGIARDPIIDVIEVECLPGDRLFATSDGAHGKLFLREMKALSDATRSAQEFIDLAIHAIEARSPDDNFSIAAVFIPQ